MVGFAVEEWVFGVCFVQRGGRGGAVVGFAEWVWVFGLCCAAKRMRGCCGWFRCGEGAFIVGDGFRFGCFVLWLVVCGW